MFITVDAESFTYIDIQLTQDIDFVININQDSYRNISEIYLPIKTKKCSPLSNKEKTLYRKAVRHLNWIAGIYRPGITFSVCEASTKFKNVTLADICHVNKIIRNIKNSKLTKNFHCVKVCNYNYLLMPAFHNLPKIVEIQLSNTFLDR